MGAPLSLDVAARFVEHAPGKLDRAAVAVLAALQDVDREPRAGVVHHGVRERDGCERSISSAYVKAHFKSRSRRPLTVSSKVRIVDESHERSNVFADVN